MSHPERKTWNFWAVISITVACGLAAGILGALISQVYIWPDFSSSFSSEVNLANLNANSAGLVIRDPKTVVVNQDVKVSETVSNLRPVLVGIFKELASTTPALASQKPNYYKLDEPLFTALIITSDGWAMALLPADLKADFKIKNYVAIASDRHLYQIDKLANLKNLPGDPLVFHLSGASNLPVKKIVPRSELTLGESLLVINGWNAVKPTTLASIIKTPAVLSSDVINARLVLADTTANFSNSFVFDLAGNLAAIVAVDGTVVPAFSYSPAWSILTAGGQSRLPYLGVNYLDLSLVKNTVLNLDKGAWLYPSPSQAAVIKDSPAQLAGLKAGDVITWVNNQPINATNDLADLLAVYQPGDTVTLTYLRSGAEKSVEIKLGDVKLSGNPDAAVKPSPAK